MKNKTAEENILSFLAANPSWYASAELQRMYWKNRNGTLAAPRTVVRRLEENVGNKLEVKYINGNAHYRIKDEHKKKTQHIQQLPNGSVRIIYA